MRLLILPGVLRPPSDAWMLAGLLPSRLSPGAAVLDVFTGSGVLAVAAARAGARVSAIDLSRRAAACARINARLNGVEVRALRGDLFAPVASESFDAITANPPYLPGADGAFPARGAARAWEGGPDGRALLDRLCDEAPAHLRPGGELLLVQSSLAGTEATLARLDGAGLRPDVVARRRGPLGPLVAERAGMLEERGLLAPGEREEELVVISGRRTP